MAGFPKKTRQAIIDGYLNATGRNQFLAGEFIDWLETQPDHEAYPWFFAKDDATAAREYRIQLARQMASGLRIIARTSEEPSEGRTVSVVTREFPAYISPVASRRGGGGYQEFDPSNPEAVAELQRQGASSLRGWLNRYRGAVEMAGVDLAPIEEIVTLLEGRVVDAA